MNSREHLAEDLDTLIKRTKQIGFIAWAVAVAVMIYGTPIAFQFLTRHEVPASLAWLLSLACDGAVCVGLIATPVLAALDKKAGWVGAIRWIAGFMTWALQTAGSWFRTGGVDGVGVAAHTIGPILLFSAIEAASSFQNKVAEAITEKTRALANAEQRDADRRAHLAETEANLRSLTAELTGARAEITSLNERFTAATGQAEAVKTEAALTAEQNEKTIGELRAALTAQAERLTADRNEAINRLTAQHTEDLNRVTAEADDTIRRLKEKHREALSVARAEKGAVSLTAYRNRAAGTPRPASTGKAEISDEAAVQMMLDAHDDPSFEWSKNGVRTLTGVGVGRAEKLIPMWLTAATEKATGGKAVNE